MIPYEQLNQRALGVLLEYLREEINRALSERRPLEEKWLRYGRAYKAQPEQPIKKFPFEGAANLVLPVMATDVDTIFSRLMGVVFGPENLWSTRALREDAVLYAPRLQEFLRWAQAAELEAYKAVSEFLLEMTKLGTGVLKQRYQREQKLVWEFRETPYGNLEQFRRLLVKDNPVLEHVSLYDFLVPAGTIDHQKAPWNAERIRLQWGQLRQRAAAGIYQNIERLARYSGDRESWLRSAEQRAQGFEPSLAKGYEVWEVWTEFDVGGIGEPVPVVCTLHLPTMTYLRVDYNPFFHQEKPYSVGRYMIQEKQFYGIGLGEMTDPFQEEGTTTHNQRLDNRTIANSVMMKARRNIGIREDEPIFPGRWFLLDNMDDVQAMPLGRNYDSSIQDEQFLLSYKDKRTGVNDYVMGNSSAAVGYATAQTNIMQHQEAAKRFDQTLREAREALGDSGRRVTELYQQFNQGGKPYLVLGPKDGDVVKKVLEFPLELIRHSVAVEVTATSASLNKETEIRTNTILMQMVTQFYTQLFQMMSYAVNPQVPPPLQMIAMQAVQGSWTLMRKLLDSYNMQEIDQILPPMQELLHGQQQSMAGMGLQPDPIFGMAQQAAGGYGAPAAGGLLPAPGMALR